MFKIKVIKKVGDVETIVEVDTDSVDMALAILRHNDVISITSDVPNRNIDFDWQDFIRKSKEYGLPQTPMTITC